MIVILPFILSGISPFQSLQRKSISGISVFHYKNFYDGMGNPHLWMILTGSRISDGYGLEQKIHHVLSDNSFLNRGFSVLFLSTQEM